MTSNARLLLRTGPAVAAVLLLSSCSGSPAQPVQSPSVDSSPSPVEPPSPLPSPSASPSANPSPLVSASPAALAIPRCVTGQLRLTVLAADSGAGQAHQRVVLTNNGARCSLLGYPGASFVDVAGRTLGSPATKSETTVRRVTLDSTRSAVAVLTYSNAGAYPDSSCAPQEASRLRIYPPGDRVALLVKDPILVCSLPGSDQLHIGPLEAGTG